MQCQHFKGLFLHFSLLPKMLENCISLLRPQFDTDLLLELLMMYLPVSQGFWSFLER